MTEAEALDMAAKAAGWLHWQEASGRTWQRPGIRAHAATLMENAALKAENEALKALRDDDGELLTIAWMDGAHRSNKAHREQNAALKAENERLRSIITRLKGYAVHDPACENIQPEYMADFTIHFPHPCTCGLSALLEEIDRD